MLFIEWCLYIIGGRDWVKPVSTKMGQNVLSEEETGWNRWVWKRGKMYYQRKRPGGTGGGKDGAKCIIRGRDPVESEVIEGKYCYYFYWSIFGINFDVLIFTCSIKSMHENMFVTSGIWMWLFVIPAIYVWIHSYKLILLWAVCNIWVFCILYTCEKNNNNCKPTWQ